MANYDSPNYPINRPGKPTLQAASEALDRQQRHSDWHDENPGQYNCPPDLCPPGDYALIEEGLDLLALGGGTFEAGDAFISKKGK